jgi:hypothetical protein
MNTEHPEHIDNRKLYDAVMERAVFDEAEAEHLGSCEECLEMIRIIVRQLLTKRAGQ